MTQQISYIPYKDYNMQHEMLVDSRFYEVFCQKVDEVVVLGRMSGYQVEYNFKEFIDKKSNERSISHHIQFQVNNRNIFVLNFYTNVHGTRYCDSSIHHFSGGNYAKHKETIKIFFDYFSDKEHFKKGFEWIAFPTIQDLIIGLVVFKHLLLKIKY